MPVRRYSFVQVDVFTRNRLEGNPLAVFTDGHGLSDAEMQAIAREMNLSETTFVLPKPTAAATPVRIFTVAEELPFAGHPTLGTAWVLQQQSRTSEIVLDLKVGKVPVRFEADGFGEMTQRDPEFLGTHTVADVARVTGLDASLFRTDVPIQTVSTGTPFVIVALRDRAALRNLQYEFSRARPYLEQSGGRFFYFIAAEGDTVAARMLFYGGEDPATGSAAGCATAWMVRYGVIPPDKRVTIEQGAEAGRPSQLYVRASRAGDRVHNVRVGGYVVEVLRGELTL